MGTWEKEERRKRKEEDLLVTGNPLGKACPALKEEIKKGKGPSEEAGVPGPQPVVPQSKDTPL